VNKNDQPVWVITEQLSDEIGVVCLEITGHARKLADELGVELQVVILGHGIQDQVWKLFAAGADLIHLGDAPEYERYQPEIFIKSIVALAENHQPQIVLIGSTFMGRELAPLIAAKLQTGLSAHCVDLVLDENGVLQQNIPAYGGIMSIICPHTRPQIATVARGVFPIPAMDDQRKGKILPVEPPKDLQIRVRTLDIIHTKPNGVPLESANVVVAGGAGAGSLTGWQEIEALAEELNAALGSTRPAVDEGWTELETMIGQSGKMVKPELYLGIGLSGEQQHMVGISGAKIMIAVNNDPKSPVFKQVDYGVVEDCRVFVPALIKKLRELKQKSGRTKDVI